MGPINFRDEALERRGQLASWRARKRGSARRGMVVCSSLGRLRRHSRRGITWFWFGGQRLHVSSNSPCHPAGVPRDPPHPPDLGSC